MPKFEAKFSLNLERTITIEAADLNAAALIAVAQISEEGFEPWDPGAWFEAEFDGVREAKAEPEEMHP